MEESFSNQVDPLIDEFDRQCGEGLAPDIEQFLEKCPTEAHELLLEQLVKVEIDYALSNCETVDHSKYARFTDTIVRLAQQHVKSRERSGTSRPKIDGHKIIRKLGGGAMGTVYLGQRQADSRQVAIKTLKRPDPSLLFRLKSEFRSIQRIPKHRNVVNLFELFVDGELASFTMEYIDGETLLKGLRKKHRSREDGLNLFCQVAEGLNYIHQQGFLHRDLKPDNILIDSNERAVILDFGLVTEMQGGMSVETFDKNLKGTVYFMSPEQAGSESLTPSSDWFSFGVMLFVYLFERYPHDGDSVLEVINNKQKLIPEFPENVDQSIPPSVVTLVKQLLQHDPAVRPTGAEIIDALQQDIGQPLDSSDYSKSTRIKQTEFWGREQEISQFMSCVQEAQTNYPYLIEIVGKSGYGKTAFVDHCLNQLKQNDSDYLFVKGRCFHQENVPYPGFDELFDNLAMELNNLGEVEKARIQPRDIHSLAGMFPVLKQVLDIKDSSQNSGKTREVKDSAIKALEEFVARICDLRKVVFVLDDFQWANLESKDLLNKLLSSTADPKLTLLLVRRDASESPLTTERESLVEHATRIELRELDRKSCVDVLKRKLDGKDASNANEILDSINGCPLYLQELLHNLDDSWSSDRNFEYSTFLTSRIRGLTDLEIRLLKLIASTEFPISVSVLNSIVDSPGMEEVLLGLEAERLIVRNQDSRLVEVYHSQVRGVVKALSTANEQSVLHKTLSSAFGSLEIARTEQVIEQFLGANDFENATQLMIAAAREAMQSFAFEESVSLLERVLELGDRSGHIATTLETKLLYAESLGSAGYAKRSSKIYAELMTESSDDKLKLEYAKQAAFQLMTSGRFEDGLKFLEFTAEHAQVTLKGADLLSILGILFNRARYLLPISWAKRRSVPNEKFQVCRILADGLTLMNPVRAAYFSAKSVRLGRSCTELDYFQARCEEAYLLCMNDDVWRRVGMQMISQLESEAESAKCEIHTANLNRAKSVCAFLRQEFEVSLKLNEVAMEQYLRVMPDAVWKINELSSSRLWTYFHHGSFRKASVAVKDLLSQAKRKNDLLSLRMFSETICTMYLNKDLVEDATREVAFSKARLPAGPYGLPDYQFGIAEFLLQSYQANWSSALEVGNRVALSIKKSGLHRIQIIRILSSNFLIISLAGTLQNKIGNRSEILSRIKKIGRQMGKEKAPYATAQSELVAVVVAHYENRRDEIREHLLKAITSFEACGAYGYANSIRYCYTRWLGEEARSRAAKFFEEQGIVNPERFTSMLVPKLPEEPN